jgi:fumarylacetoacetate (FAA) hydrolase
LRTRTAFGPVAVTPDELGDAWSRGRVHLPLRVTWNGRAVGRCDAGAGMTFHFGRLLAHLCQTRAIGAGAIVGCGPVCNATDARKGRGDGSGGYSAIAQKRAVEILQDGRAATGFLQVGDTVRIDMTGRDGASLFGAIEQEVRARTGVRG